MQLILLTLLAGACNVLAFAPFHVWPLQILALAWLFRQAARQPGIRRNFLLGWIYGFGWTAAGVHWLYISMHTYGGMVAWMAALAVGLLALFIGLYSALALSLATWLQRRWRCSEAAMLLLLLPALWVLTEWARGWIFTGFPWLSAGYAHSVGPLKGYAPLLGVYGLGWIAALIAGCCVLATRRRSPDNAKRRPQAAKAVAAIVVLLAGGIALHAIDWTVPKGAPIGVRLLQGNIAQETKFSESALLSTLEYYNAAIREAPADLIAIPETAIPLLPQQLPANYLERLEAYAQASGSHLALGIPLSDAPGAYSNSLVMFAPPASSGAAPAPYRYDKHHLVPFGEFIPLGFRWFVDMMHIPLGDMTRGAVLQAPFAVKDQWIMPNICYEDLFGEEIAEQLGSAWFAGKPPASILLNISNIAWFGDSIALPQHLQISQMRSLESGRPMLRATNTGATAMIDPKGRIAAELPPYTQGVLAEQVQGYQGWTPYMLAGNKMILAIALLAMLWARLRAKLD
ncbi:MAG TPA: apolipoprotein N-acyltransferase [Herbaspirillum sp.]